MSLNLKSSSSSSIVNQDSQFRLDLNPDISLIDSLSIFSRACLELYKGTRSRVSVGNTGGEDHPLESNNLPRRSFDILSSEGRYCLVSKVDNKEIDLSRTQCDKKGSRFVITNPRTTLDIAGQPVYFPHFDLSKFTFGKEEADLLKTAQAILTDLERNISYSQEETCEFFSATDFVKAVDREQIKALFEQSTSLMPKLLEYCLNNENILNEPENLLLSFSAIHQALASIVDESLLELSKIKVLHRLDLVQQYAKLLSRILYSYEQSYLEEDNTKPNRSPDISYASSLEEKKAFLVKNGLPFRHSFKDRNVIFECTDIFSMRSDRFGFFAIIDNGYEEPRLRLFYVSNSHACYRLLPACNYFSEQPRYDKAGNELILPPPASIQEKLALIANRCTTFPKHLSKEFCEALVRQNFSAEEYEEYLIQTDLSPVKRSIDRIVSILEEPLFVTSTTSWLPPEAIQIANHDWEPNFDKLKSHYKSFFPLYGMLSSYVFSSHDESLDFVFRRTKQGESFISLVSSNEGDLNNFGLARTIIDAGELCLSLYEHKKQVDSNYKGESHSKFRNYKKVVGYHSRNPYLSEFESRLARQGFR